MRRNRLFPLLGVLFLLSSCAGPAPTIVTPTPSAVISPSPSAAPVPTASALPAGPPVWGVQESECSKSAEDGTLLVSGRFSLPLIENAQGSVAYAAINDYYLDLSAGLRSDSLMNAPQAADDYAASKAMEYDFTPYSDEETYEVKHETANFVSILRTHYGHTGGVYPSLLYMSDHFDLSTGASLSFADFFADPDKAAAAILDEIVRQGDEAFTADQLKSLFNREAFYFTGDGLVFFYQPDLNTVHAAGAAEFTIPYDLLEGDLLR